MYMSGLCTVCPVCLVWGLCVLFVWVAFLSFLLLTLDSVYAHVFSCSL